jgi:hypothetical protein
MKKANATRSEEQTVYSRVKEPRWNDLYEVHIGISVGLHILTTFCREIDRRRLRKPAIAKRINSLRRNLARQLKLADVPFHWVSDEFALTRTDTAKACGREAVSAHAIAFWLLTTLGSPIVGARSSNGLEMVCSLDRNELNSLHPQMTLEWMRAATARLNRGGQPTNFRELTSGFWDEPGVSGKPMTGAEEASAKPIRNRSGRGGRPRKWVELFELYVKMTGSDPEVSGKAICAAYNQRYGRAFRSGEKSRATPKILSKVVYEYTHRKRAQTHE